MRIALISDNLVLRAALRCLLKSWNISAVATECGSDGELPEQLRFANPDVAIVDLSVEFDVGLLRKIRSLSPQCRLLLLARSLAPELFFHLREEGGYNIVCVKANVETFLEYLHGTIDGRSMLDPSVLPAGYQESRVTLGPRQAELVSLLVQGLKNKEIAAALNITEGTVKVQLSRLFEKLHVKDRFELALFGLRNMSMIGEAARMPPNRPGPQSETATSKTALILDWRETGSGRMRTPARRRREGAM